MFSLTCRLISSPTHDQRSNYRGDDGDGDDGDGDDGDGDDGGGEGVMMVMILEVSG